MNAATRVDQRAPRDSQLAWFIPRSTWRRIVLVSGAIALALSPLYTEDSAWIGVGIFLTVAVAWHTIEARNALPWLPGLIVLSACVQWILAPWAAYHLPLTSPSSGMAVGPAEYFSYAIATLIALAIGLYLPTLRYGRIAVHRAHPKVGANLRPLRLTSEVFVVVGAFASMAIAGGMVGGGLKFAVYLVSILGFVGALGLALLRVPGWQWRAIVPFAFVAYRAAADGSFLEFLFWVVYFAASVAYQYRVKMRILVPFALIGAFAVVTINGYKNFYRESIRMTGADSDVRAGLTADALLELVKAPGRVLSPQSLSFSVNRLNMGWVTSRALAWTPRIEPFANGETVETALRAALLPRLIDNDKYVAGGKDNTPRFTGVQLYNQTSINLGVAAEMYVNYGLRLGAVAVFVYALLVGWMFSLFVRWSRSSQLWWAWAPYVLFSTLSAEGGLGETLNQLVKSAFVMMLVIAVAPGWSRLWRELRRGRRTKTAVGILEPRGIP